MAQGGTGSSLRLAVRRDEKSLSSACLVANFNWMGLDDLFPFFKAGYVHTVNSSLGEAVWSYCFNIAALCTGARRWESRNYKVHFDLKGGIA